MDDEINISAEQIANLTPDHQRELHAFINVENQKAAIQKSMPSPVRPGSMKPFLSL